MNLATEFSLPFSFAKSIESTIDIIRLAAQLDLNI